MFKSLWTDVQMDIGKQSITILHLSTLCSGEQKSVGKDENADLLWPVVDRFDTSNRVHIKS